VPGHLAHAALAYIRWVSACYGRYLKSMRVLVEMFSTTWSDYSFTKYS
jgi:hypothetical protein